eukprot:4039911-Prymnesium_polylepis.1
MHLLDSRAARRRAGRQREPRTASRAAPRVRRRHRGGPKARAPRIHTHALGAASTNASSACAIAATHPSKLPHSSMIVTAQGINRL